MNSKEAAQKLLDRAGVTINGTHPWDLQVHDERLYDRFFSEGTMAMGDSYLDGWWDVEDIAAFLTKIMRSGAGDEAYNLLLVKVIPHFLRNQIFNLQKISRAFHVGEKHYDVGNDLFERMLDPTMTYSCGYWKGVSTLEGAQRNKLDLICRKIGLKKGDRVLDIGCGWGGFLVHAATKYGIKGVGLTISKEQAELARKRAQGLPIEIRLQDYRKVTDGPFDHVVSVGMFEHVGWRNYRTYMETVRKLLKEDGLFLLHTIGNNKTVFRAEPWVEKHIFPNGYIPSPAQIGQAVDRKWFGEPLFVIEDWHNFGADYDKTLVAWFENFDRAWPGLKGDKYDDRFYRMWKFYLLSCAGGFRARWKNLWQIVLSPKGVLGGYQSVR